MSGSLAYQSVFRPSESAAQLDDLLPLPSDGSYVPVLNWECVTSVSVDG